MSRHSRLFLVLAPGLAFSNVAFALTVNVSSTATGDCDSTNTAQIICAEATVAEAIEAVNAKGDVANVIDIDEAAYAPTATETNLPIIEYATTIRSDGATPAARAWRLQAIRATADLTLENLTLESGDITETLGSGEWYSAVDVQYGDLTGTNLLFEAGTHDPSGGTPFDRPYPKAAFVREGEVTLSDVTATEADGYYDGGVYLDDYYSYYDRHDVTITDSTFTGNYGGNSPYNGVVSAYFAGHVTIEGSTFTDNGGFGVGMNGYGLTIADSTFDGNEGAAWFSADGGEGAIPVAISDSTIIDSRRTDYNCCGRYSASGAVTIEGWNGIVDATIDGTTFDGNYHLGFGAADLVKVGYGGTLDVTDTTFEAFQGYYNSAGSTYLSGGRSRFTDVSWDGTGASGGEGYNGQVGGALFLDEGEIFCTRCEFTDVISQSDGGAVMILGGVYGGEGVATFASFTDSTFTNTTSLYSSGGALSVLGPSIRVEMDGVRFANTSAAAGTGEAVVSEALGGIGYYFGPGGGAISLNGLQGDFGKRQLGGSYLYGGEGGVTFVGNDITIDGASAPIGGAFTLLGAGNTLQLTDSVFSDTEALAPIIEVPVTGNGITGLGGLVFASQGNTIEISDSTVNGAAAFLGGALFSAFETWYYEYPNGNLSEVLGGESPSECFYPSYGTYYDGPSYGTKWDIDGVAFNDGVAVLGASVAFFGRFDDVSLKASTITGNVTAGRGTIVSLNASRIEASCNTFCDNDVAAGGSAFEIYDDSMPPEFYAYYDWYGAESRKDIRYEIGNNVFQDGTTDIDVEGPDGAAVYVDLCYYSAGYARGSSGYGGETRGHVMIENNTFVGNVGGNANLEGYTADTRLDVRGNLFQDGVAGWIVGGGSSFVEGGYNLYGNLVDDVIDDQGLGFDVLDATNQTSPAVFRSYTPGTCESELYLQPGSPGIDQGDPDPSRHDTWGNDPTAVPPLVNRGDIGAFGGAGACVPDADNDTFNAILDCDDEMGTTYPDAVEVPYDGIDQDCDGEDLCDLDGDGADAAFGECTGTDCNDLDATIHPGAVDIPDDGIDQDCSGFDSSVCDVDGDGHPNEECGGHDCDDTDADIFPGAEEIPYDGIDQDCDGGDLIDVDCDGFASAAVTDCPEGIECTDCDDNDATIFPGASDNPLDDIDQDCDGEPAELWAQGGCGCATPSPTPVGGGAFGLLAAALAFVRRRGQR